MSKIFKLFSTLVRRREIDDFEADFQLIITNCQYYNSQNSTFYSQAEKMKNKVSCVIVVAVLVFFVVPL